MDASTRVQPRMSPPNQPTVNPLKINDSARCAENASAVVGRGLQRLPMGLRTASGPRLSTCVYTIVVLTSECPSSACRVRMSYQSSNKCVAKECRREVFTKGVQVKHCVQIHRRAPRGLPRKARQIDNEQSPRDFLSGSGWVGSPFGVSQDRTDRRSRGVGSEHFERASDNGCRDAIRDTTAVSA